MKAAQEILSFLLERGVNGERTALVTVTAVIGGSARSPGEHMAVCESGAYVGSISGGCIEAAVVGEAQRAIREQRAQIVRFGIGSPMIDIRLPCGGGLDLLITPEPPLAEVEKALTQLRDRAGASLLLGRDGSLQAGPMMGAGASYWDEDRFVAVHEPALRLCILGHGAETVALTKLALAYRACVDVLSPDTANVEAALSLGASAHRLKTPAATAQLWSDPYTAIVMLFHDHDWESALLEQALGQDAFYVGAMGSRQTHGRRLEHLRAKGVPDSSLARLVGPIGDIPATRDPETLALSVLSQIVARQAQDRSARRIDSKRLQD